MAKKGRRRGSDGEQSRALLLSIAAEEFAVYGYHETKISNIVKKAGVSQPTFYLYFKSKEAIFQELVDLFRSDLRELTNQIRLEPDIDEAAVAAQIEESLKQIFRFFDENQNLTRIGFYVSVESIEIKTLMAAQIEENLVFEVEEGYFRQDIDMKIAAESLVGVIERLTFHQLFEGLKRPEELSREVVGFFLYGMLNSRQLTASYS
ncbi:TetR/AcrR family transcriptional regulator [Planococcus salinus]|uniref:TetR/AcrR family transcriptional regulator n=1 Tax=Planococcus salinus TaxID=1848460 RepID=A0A3M8P3G9_9BACL|nr:TetR/AcrR family transcriptional regulator [Planococcus salinus]RNF38259.1 TetR/AcrR family transcriptional regulator [Planococcus salinus]